MFFSINLQQVQQESIGKFIAILTELFSLFAGKRLKRVWNDCKLTSGWWWSKKFTQNKHLMSTLIRLIIVIWSSSLECIHFINLIRNSTQKCCCFVFDLMKIKPSNLNWIPAKFLGLEHVPLTLNRVSTYFYCAPLLRLSVECKFGCSNNRNDGLRSAVSAASLIQLAAVTELNRTKYFIKTLNVMHE